MGSVQEKREGGKASHGGHGGHRGGILGSDIGGFGSPQSYRSTAFSVQRSAFGVQRLASSKSCPRSDQAGWPAVLSG